MDASELAKLDTVADSIASGRPVDWDQLHPEAGETAAVIRQLKALEGIATFHRKMELSPGPMDDHGHEARHSLGTWGPFTLLDLIGEGKFGAVYLAHDPKLMTNVALKLVTLAADRSADVARGLREARLLARVRHPNVVTVYGADVIDGRAGIWMEFVKGQTLAALVDANGPLGAREAALVAVDLCQALAAVHRVGLLHGDVKAHNVMRASGGRTVLMDFGTGKDLQGQTGDPRVQRPDIAGTPLYLAPEVFRGAPRSKLGDVYSLGVLLYHLVTDGYPVEGRTPADVARAHEQGVRTSLRDARPDLPPEFVAAVERATAADPRERFQSIAAFESALASFLGLGRSAPVPSRLRWWPAAAAVTILALLGVRYWIDRQSVEPGRPSSVVATAVPAPAVAPSTYRIETVLFARRNDREIRLRPGDRVSPGDQVFARLRVSAPTYVYIVNEDDQGESFLLFPLPGQAVENPIAAGAPTRIPGTENDGVSWQVSSAGGREHFLIFASPERLQAFEDLFASLPHPSFAGPAASRKLPAQALGTLRSVGKLTAPPPTQPAGRLATIFTSPLGDAEETAHGLWVRQLTLENPVRR